MLQLLEKSMAAWQPTPVFLPGESHGQKSLAGYSPYGHREPDTTEVTLHAWTGSLNTDTPYDPAIPLLLIGIYPREIKIYAYTKICTWVFTETLS